MYDVIIIGGGPIGIACGIAAKKKGLSYLIIEKGTLANSIYKYPKNMQFFSTSEKLELENIPFVSIAAKPTRDEALEYYRRVTSINEVNIHLFEKVIATKKIAKNFTIQTNKSEYQTRNIVIATGFYDSPNLINVKGEGLPKVSHYYNDPFYYVNQKLAVIGASNSSVDAALECYRKGADVTLIIRGNEIGKRVKYWVRPDIINRIKEGSIAVYYQTTVKEITAKTLLLNTPTGIKTIYNDFVLALTGYKPNFSILKSLNVILSDDEKLTPTYNDETMESNIQGLYLAGVVCGGMETHKWFIENSRIHAINIMNAIAKKD